MAGCFLEEIEERIVLFDGATGTEIQKLNLKPEDLPNNKHGFNGELVLSRQKCIENIHGSYLGWIRLHHDEYFW